MSSLAHDEYVQSLISEVNAAAEAFPKESFSDDKARKRLQAAALRLSGALDAPIDGVRKILFQPHQILATRIGVEGGWFHALGKGRGPKTAAQLAGSTGAETQLIVRIMRVLTSVGIVGEVGIETYVPTPVSDSLTQPEVYHSVIHFFDDSWPVFVKFPDYLKRNGYKVPTDPKTGPCVEVHGKQLFDYFHHNPDRGTSFAVFMAGQRHGRTNWLDVYPIEQRMLRDYQHSPDAVLLVDIAGGRGHDLKDFHARHLKVPGRLVLEDRPEIVSQIDPAWREGIETVAYDFFTPQPIKGAKAYYFRAVLHDWDDASCRKILKNQISAMKPGYSRILINEMVLEDTGTNMFGACLDVGVMYMLCGMQRSRQQWHDLLDSVGLRVVEIWTLEEGAEALIEANLKGDGEEGKS